jgi:hypothetical protein
LWWMSEAWGRENDGEDGVRKNLVVSDHNKIVFSN